MSYKEHSLLYNHINNSRTWNKSDSSIEQKDDFPRAKIKKSPFSQKIEKLCIVCIIKLLQEKTK